MRIARSLTIVAVSALLGLAPAAVAAQEPARSPVVAAQSDRAAARPAPARNIILFLADAGGVSVLSAASLMAYGEQLRLHVQGWPHLGLSETSPVDEFVSDSANGMSAIVTGVKTRNGVISQGPDAVRGRTDGVPTKTLLEYAEARGLRTGVITTQAITDATPAANYAHANDRNDWGGIFPQAFAPRFGDGVDVLIGAGRQPIAEQLAARGTSFAALGEAHDRPVYDTLDAAPEANQRPIVVADAIGARAATLRALDILERSDTGYFLVVEWDAHTDDPRQGLQNVVDFDKLIAEVEQRVDLDDTLLLFTADHSFGLQVDGGRRGQPLLDGYEAWKAAGVEGMVRLDHVLVNTTHTAEEVPALAIGAGAEGVRGYFPNTHLFEVMISAWGWSPDTAPSDPVRSDSEAARPDADGA
ncbi:alkaline phosphatase [Brevundimonas sp. LM2]|uniref:alkaline phosphatase n=1 Tax=Brevundimonas sp. LM2 TaxID=1938605 RepID=UPI0009855138|nr:alkaline phosphatase [Brevundimonas sp. LM2]